MKLAQSCLTLCDPMDIVLYRPWNSSGQNTRVGSLSLPLLQGTFPTQGSNPGPPYCRQILYQLSHKGSSVVKNLSAKQETQVGKIPWRRKWEPPPVFLPGKPYGQKSLEGYSLWGHKESDMTERVNITNYFSLSSTQ